MKINSSWYPISRLSLRVGAIGASVGIFLGILAGLQPLLLCLAIAVIILVLCFFTYFEQTVLGLLILRTSLDIFAAQKVPAVFAVGMIALALLYLLVSLLLRRKINTDKLWWFLAAWVACQGLWVIFLPLGGLGRGSAQLMNAIEEWVRLFSWVMVYFLIMQLKGRIHPKKVINCLFLSLIAPLTGALLQIAFPPSVLPSFLVCNYAGCSAIEAGARINGTMGHPNSLASFTLLFIGLSLWKLEEVKKYLPWLILIGLLVFVLASTKSIGGLVLIAVFTMVFIIPRLNLLNLVGAVFLLGLVVIFFSNSDFGQERLASLYETPLLNPDLDLSHTILLAWGDGNSINWRIAQWTYLLESWRDFPIMGYGLATTRSVSVFENYAHNDYLAALVEEGIVGFILFLSFLASQFINIIQIIFRPLTTRPQKSLCLILLSLLIAMSVAMIFENILSHTTLFFFWFTILAIAGWDWSERNRSLPL